MIDNRPHAPPEQDLLAGGYLITKADVEHDVPALTDATIFVSSQQEAPIVA